MQSFNNIQASLAPIADAPAPAGPAGALGIAGKFTFSPDEIRAVITDWMTLGDEYTPSIATAKTMVVVAPPGDEYASQAHAERTNESGTRYVESLKQKQKYCYDQAQKFQDALHDYLGIERVNIRRMESADQDVLSAPGRI